MPKADNANHKNTNMQGTHGPFSKHDILFANSTAISNLGRSLKVRLSQNEFMKSLIFQKNDPKNLKDFCPMYYKNSQGRNPSNFLGQFLEIDDFKNSF